MLQNICLCEDVLLFLPCLLKAADCSNKKKKAEQPIMMEKVELLGRVNSRSNLGAWKKAATREMPGACQPWNKWEGRT